MIPIDIQVSRSRVMPILKCKGISVFIQISLVLFRTVTCDYLWQSVMFQTWEFCLDGNFHNSLWTHFRNTRVMHCYLMLLLHCMHEA